MATPDGIRKVIAEQGLEGAVLYLHDLFHGQAEESAHEQNSLLYSLQGKLEQVEDRVTKLEENKAPATEPPVTPPVAPAAEGTVQ